MRQTARKNIEQRDAGAGTMEKLPSIDSVRLVFFHILSGLFHKYAHVRGNGFWTEARRERRTYPEVDLQGASNDASVQKTCRPEGCSEFGLWLRGSVGRVSLRGYTSFPRASPQAKFGATNVCVFMK